jgi:hypothetical protein
LNAHIQTIRASPAFALTAAQRSELDALPFALTIAHLPSAFVRATVHLDASDMPAALIDYVPLLLELLCESKTHRAGRPAPMSYEEVRVSGFEPIDACMRAKFESNWISIFYWFSFVVYSCHQSGDIRPRVGDRL